MSKKNTVIIFKKRPDGEPTEDCFETKEEEMPSVEDGQILLKTLWLSVDPYMRIRMTDSSDFYQAPLKTGEPMEGGCVCMVQESKAKEFSKGDYVVANISWKNYVAVEPKKVNAKKVEKEKEFPLHYYLHALGMTGLTAWSGVNLIGEPKKGETAFVSGAAGAVGSIVGQLCKIAGCKVVGTAGSKEKIDLIKELGFNEAINYKTTKDLKEDLKKSCPDGIDFYFDNVGGETLDAALQVINRDGRIAQCGAISQYNSKSEDDVYAIKHTDKVLMKCVKWVGFLVGKYYDRFDEFSKEMKGYLKEDKVKVKYSVTEGGLKAAPKAFIGLFKGDNIGKAVVKIADDEKED